MGICVRHQSSSETLFISFLFDHVSVLLCAAAAETHSDNYPGHIRNHISGLLQHMLPVFGFLGHVVLVRNSCTCYYMNSHSRCNVNWPGRYGFVSVVAWTNYSDMWALECWVMDAFELNVFIDIYFSILSEMKYYTVGVVGLQ